MDRSYEPITKLDLELLAAIAMADRDEFFQRNPETARLYSERLFAVALCQGGALHYLNGINGVKDLDVWSFYREHPDRPFPYRRRAEADLGVPKFGTTEGCGHFVGRKVDLIGRSLPNVDIDDPVGTLQRYLRGGRTESARQLAKKAVILLAPAHLLGTVVWPLRNLAGC